MNFILNILKLAVFKKVMNYVSRRFITKGQYGHQR